MRLIWTTEQPEEIAHFQALLHSKGIESLDEIHVEDNWDSNNYRVPLHKLWIHDEDRLEETKLLLAQFLATARPYSAPKNPTSPPKKSPLKPHLEHIPPRPTPRYSLSNLIILICSALLLATMWTDKPSSPIPAQFRNRILTTSPVEKALLYDYPESFVLLDKLSMLYGYDTLLTPSKLPPAGQFLYKNYQQAETWKGLYPWIASRGAASVTDAPLFEKIREGEIWRLVTPIFLHADFLHLFFNMVWLILLGTQMEMHLSLGRYALFIILSAVFSNTAQYMVSGCAFLGFSGVVCAIAFFIHSRQRVAPWEGYQLSKPTYQFILFFIGTLACLSLLTFVLEFFNLGTFPIQVANTAHLAGALAGYLMGRLRFFAAK